ncbi:hypothetical protein ACYOEI_12205 [Singulisphaera rosea]
MERRVRSAHWRLWLGTSLIVFGGMAIGCGGDDKEGNAEFRQNFDRPKDLPPPPKVKKTPFNQMTPREKRAFKKAEAEGQAN